MSYTGTLIEQAQLANPDTNDPAELAKIIFETSTRSQRDKILQEILPSYVRSTLGSVSSITEASHTPPSRRPAQPRSKGRHAGRKVRTWREKQLSVSVYVPNFGRKTLAEVTLADCRVLVQDYRLAAQENDALADRFERFEKLLRRKRVISTLGELSEEEFTKAYGDPEIAAA